MNRRYARAHLSDQVVLQSAVTNAARERTATADLLADLAEIDDRKLYLPLAFPSLLAYCMAELHLCEQTALKRIRVARVARRFPGIFNAVAQGQIHLTAVVLLAPHLTEETVDELLTAARHKSRSEIERLLAERFPKSDVLPWVAPALPARAGEPQAPAPVEVSPGTVAVVHEVAKVTPLSSQSYAFQVTLDQESHDDLCYAQALLGHQVPSGDITQVLGLVLKAAIRHLEKQKFAVSDRPHASRRASANPRHIPAHVRRAVLERDEGRCAFVSEDGHRCRAEAGLEFDHVLEVARGGEATVDGIRLLCRAHNQYAAERTYGREFMRHKRIAAAEARVAAKEHARAGDHAAAKVARAHPAAAKAARALATPANPQRTNVEDDDRDVVPWLRALGFSAAEARRAAARCEGIADAPLEERVRVALMGFRARGSRVERTATPPSSATAPTPACSSSPAPRR